MNAWERYLDQACEETFQRMFIQLHSAIDTADNEAQKAEATNAFTRGFIFLLETRERARKQMNTFLPMDMQIGTHWFFDSGVK